MHLVRRTSAPRRHRLPPGVQRPLHERGDRVHRPTTVQQGPPASDLQRPPNPRGHATGRRERSLPGGGTPRNGRRPRARASRSEQYRST
eukprot:3153216-Prymnesium_polylepis.1